LARPEQATVALRRARRLSQDLGDLDGVRRPDDELSWAFEVLGDYRRMLSAVTRLYVGLKGTPQC